MRKKRRLSLRLKKVKLASREKGVASNLGRERGGPIHQARERQGS